jgi:hypothetical protein
LSIKSLLLTRFERGKYLMNLLESLMKRLKAITNEVGNHKKY